MQNNGLKVTVELLRVAVDGKYSMQQNNGQISIKVNDKKQGELDVPQVYKVNTDTMTLSTLPMFR